MGEIETCWFTNNSVMLLKFNRPVMLIIWILHYYFSCIFITVEVYGIYKPEVLLLLFLDFLPASFFLQFAMINHTSFVIISYHANMHQDTVCNCSCCSIRYLMSFTHSGKIWPLSAILGRCQCVWWFCYKLISSTWLRRVCACWFRLRYVIYSWFSFHLTVASRRTREIWFYFWMQYELLVRWCQRQKNIQTFCYMWPLLIMIKAIILQSFTTYSLSPNIFAVQCCRKKTSNNLPTSDKNSAPFSKKELPRFFLDHWSSLLKAATNDCNFLDMVRRWRG